MQHISGKSFEERSITRFEGRGEAGCTSCEAPAVCFLPAQGPHTADLAPRDRRGRHANTVRVSEKARSRSIYHLSVEAGQILISLATPCINSASRVTHAGRATEPPSWGFSQWSKQGHSSHFLHTTLRLRARVPVCLEYRKFAVQVNGKMGKRNFFCRAFPDPCSTALRLPTLRARTLTGS
jgi:hypothetical protein